VIFADPVVFGERYWMNLQSYYYEAKRARAKMAGKIEAIRPLVAA
jgi:hypothetical protein